jgi:hypothetical protein
MQDLIKEIFGDDAYIQLKLSVRLDKFNFFSYFEN